MDILLEVVDEMSFFNIILVSCNSVCHFETRYVNKMYIITLTLSEQKCLVKILCLNLCHLKSLSVFAVTLCYL